MIIPKFGSESRNVYHETQGNMIGYGMQIPADKPIKVQLNAYHPSLLCNYGKNGGCASCCEHNSGWASKEHIDNLREHWDQLKAYTEYPNAEFNDMVNWKRAPNPVGSYELGRKKTDDDTSPCKFLAKGADGFKGCSIHRYCMDKNIPVHHLKPYDCLLFPILIWERPTYIAIYRHKWDYCQCLPEGKFIDPSGEWSNVHEDIRGEYITLHKSSGYSHETRATWAKKKEDTILYKKLPEIKDMFGIKFHDRVSNILEAEYETEGTTSQ